MEELRDQRANRASRHDDRPLGAEGAAGSDRYRRGNRLQNGNLRINPAAVGQNGFDRLGDSVAAYPLGSITSHHADDERADYGYDHLEHAKRVSGRRDQRGAPALEEEKVGKESDQLEKCEGDISADHPDEDRHQADGDDARPGGKIAER